MSKPGASDGAPHGGTFLSKVRMRQRSSARVEGYTRDTDQAI